MPPGTGRSPRSPRGGEPSLPPLTQPTGELPRVSSRPAPADDLPGPIADDPAHGLTGDRDGVFGQPPSDAEDGETGLARFDSPMPSAIPAADDPFDIAADATGVMPAVDSVDDVFGGVTGDVDPDGGQEIRSGFAAAAREHAPTNPFPGTVDDVEDDLMEGLAGGPRSDTGQLRSFDDPLDTVVDSGRPLAVGVSAAAARQAGSRPASGTAPLDAPTDLGQPPRGGRSDRSDRRGGNESTERLQDTEFKLADRPRKQKPKEPNRLILALAMGLVVLAGIAVAWFLTRDGGDEGTDAATPDADAEVVATPEATAEDTPVETVPPAEPEPLVDEPTLFFDEAQTGPLQQGQTYGIDIAGESEGSLLQVVVDDIPQGTPDPQLPDLILPAGRHSLYIQITNGAEVTTSTPVEVYVLGDPPPRGFRANLSSVDIQNEGWAEAVRQFDEFRAAGHEALQLAPLSEGYWNIFIGGLGEERSAAVSYCESFGLSVPDQCFPDMYEGAAPAETTDTSTTETTVAESMEESTSTSTAGG